MLLVTFRADLTLLGDPDGRLSVFPRSRDFGYILIASSLINVDDFSATSYHLELVKGTEIEIDIWLLFHRLLNSAFIQYI